MAAARRRAGGRSAVARAAASMVAAASAAGDVSRSRTNGMIRRSISRPTSLSGGVATAATASSARESGGPRSGATGDGTRSTHARQRSRSAACRRTQGQSERRLAARGKDGGVWIGRRERCNTSGGRCSAVSGRCRFGERFG
eukprot:5209728-Prymnesium_polylepis.1